MKNFIIGLTLLGSCGSAYANSMDCKSAAIEAAKSKSMFGNVLVFAKRVYGPNETGDEVYLVKFKTKQTMSDSIDTDLVSVSLQADKSSGCDIQESALMISHTP